MFECCVFDFGLIERCVLEQASFEGKRKCKRVAGIKAQTEHFAIDEADILKRSLQNLRHAEVAVLKCAINKPKIGELRLG